MKNICIVGAGQLGSRHLQALKAIEMPLNILVVDPVPESLSISKDRYDAIDGNSGHQIRYLKSIDKINVKEVDICIVATNANVRRLVIDQLLEVTKVNYFVLEKLLFREKEDYFHIKEVLNKNNIKTYVNCSMRTMPFYYHIKEALKGERFTYHVSGSQYGLATNLIHFLDHIAFLSDCNEFVPDTRFLNKNIISSKREGYLEVTGTYVADYKNGSKGIITCYPNNDAPIVVEFQNEHMRCISKESEGKVWLSKGSNNWKWEEIDFQIPYQSQLTTKIVEDIFELGKCNLVTYNEVMNVHITLLDSLLDFLNNNSENEYDYYPFT